VKERVGIAGVGLMGLGIARNVVAKGYSLIALEHAGNQPLDDLKRSGARTTPSCTALAAECDVVILCVTGSPEVEAVLMGDGGILAGLREGSVVVDCSTSVPSSTVRMAQAVTALGCSFIDAPMTRTAQHAHEGRLNLLVGADAQVLARVKPVLECFADSIVHAGPVGAGHTLKLLHNFVSLGTASVIAEAAACASRMGIDPSLLVDVLSGGGGGGVALERMKPYIVGRDPSGLRFYMSNALKDLQYYIEMASDRRAFHQIADAIAATLAVGVDESGPRALLPELVSLLAERDCISQAPH